MTTDDEQTTSAEPIEDEAEPAKPVELRTPTKATRPNKPLPTIRIAFPKQLDILRGFVAAAGANRKPVTLAEVGAIVKLHPNTISLANGFFVDVGLLERVESTKFRPSDAVYEFAQAHEWKPETAAHKLSPLLTNTWFWTPLEGRLKFNPNMPEREALAILAEGAGASPDYAPQLRLILAFLEAAGFIAQDSGIVRLQATPLVQPEVPPKRETPLPPSPKPPTGGVSTTFTQQPEGMVQFAVSVRVDMTELRTWKPERIAAFFAGIAQVLAAKGDMEMEATDER